MTPGAIFVSVLAAWMVIGLGIGTVKALRAPDARPWLVVPSGMLALYGFAAFMGQAVAGAGALSFVPSTVEFPVWRPEVTFRSARDLTFVGLGPVGRIQVYDASGRFLRGWFVPTSGKAFQILPAPGGIEVRGIKPKPVFYDDHGRVIEPDAVLARREDLLLNPKPPVDVDWSAPWWPLTSPFLAWAVGAIGMVGLYGQQLRERVRSMRRREPPLSRW
jgi:hypothetical protein